jgi:hypothetical protein
MPLPGLIVGSVVWDVVVPLVPVGTLPSSAPPAQCSALRRVSTPVAGGCRAGGPQRLPHLGVHPRQEAVTVTSNTLDAHQAVATATDRGVRVNPDSPFPLRL